MGVELRNASPGFEVQGFDSGFGVDGFNPTCRVLFLRRQPFSRTCLHGRAYMVFGHVCFDHNKQLPLSFPGPFLQDAVGQTRRTIVKTIARIELNGTYEDSRILKPNVCSVHLKPSTLDPTSLDRKPQTENPKPETRNPKPETRKSARQMTIGRSRRKGVGCNTTSCARRIVTNFARIDLDRHHKRTSLAWNSTGSMNEFRFHEIR